MNNLIAFRRVLIIALIAIAPFTVFGNAYLDSTVVQLQLSSKSLSNEIILSITLSARGHRALKVPTIDNLLIGYEDDSKADGFLEVYEVGDSSNTKLVPTEDYQTFNKKKELNTLRRGNSISYRYKISDLYTLDTKKKYKIRVIFKLSTYNIEKDIKSNWIVISPATG